MSEIEQQKVCGSCPWFEEQNYQIPLIIENSGNKGMCRFFQRPTNSNNTPELVAFSEEKTLSDLQLYILRTAKCHSSTETLEELAARTHSLRTD